MSVEMEKSTALDSILRYAPPTKKDAGAGDDNSSGHPGAKEPEILHNATAHQTVRHANGSAESPGIFCRIGYQFLRIVLYLIVLAILIIGGLYALKLAGFYDPCKDYFYVSDTKCTVKSYMKGFLHHVDCFEEQYCYLPGFSSSSSRKSWSFKAPPVQAQDESSGDLQNIDEEYSDETLIET